MIQRFKDKRNISNKTKIDNYFTNEKKKLYTVCDSYIFNFAIHQ